MKHLLLLALCCGTHAALVLPSPCARSTPAQMQFFGGGGGSSNSARDKDFARRQDRLAARKQTAKAAPKGQVTVTFPQKNKKTVCQQGQPIGQVASKAGVRIKFDCKNGRCGTCTVRLNGRAAAKICQGARIPGGATKSLSITLDNP